MSRPWQSQSQHLDTISRIVSDLERVRCLVQQSEQELALELTYLTTMILESDQSYNRNEEEQELHI